MDITIVDCLIENLTAYNSCIKKGFGWLPPPAAATSRPVTTHFEPFRAIGYITSSVPFSVQRLGTETFVTVSFGKSWQIYNCAKRSLVLVGPQITKKIRALASYRDYTFAAYGNEIGVFKRAHQVATWTKHNAKVNLLLLFGDHILSVDVEGNIFIWAFKGADENPSPIGHI
ncbi:hypothetical protein LXL04_037814 [Taraxacum kok-saghyz]